MSSYKAVIFDVGGVVCRSPLIAIAAYEQEHLIPNNYINCSITQRGPGGAWQRFERGEMNLWDFYTAFGRELSDTIRGNVWYRNYCKRVGIACPTLPDNLAIDGRELFIRMMKQAGELDPLIVHVIHRLRALGTFRIIALTNNFSAVEPLNMSAPPRGFGDMYPGFISVEAEMKSLGWNDGIAPRRLRDLFEDFCDSSLFGMRKPEPEFYLAACKRNQVLPSDCVFLDDLRINLKPAQELGMQTIHVPIGGSLKAIQQLETILGVDLTGGFLAANGRLSKL